MKMRSIERLKGITFHFYYLLCNRNFEKWKWQAIGEWNGINFCLKKNRFNNSIVFVFGVWMENKWTGSIVLMFELNQRSCWYMFHNGDMIILSTKSTRWCVITLDTLFNKWFLCLIESLQHVMGWIFSVQMNTFFRFFLYSVCSWISAAWAIHHRRPDLKS